MPNKRFLRRNTREYLKLGSKRKKIRKWRRPRGRDNKMRLRMKGYPLVVKVGYKQENVSRGKTDGKEIKLVQNISDLSDVSNKKVLLGKIGKKKKIEIAKAVIGKKIEFINFNPEKLLEEIKPKEKK